MAIAHDAYTRYPATDGTETTTGNRTFTHTPSGSPSAIIVIVHADLVNVAPCTGVLYGGVAMAATQSANNTTSSDNGCVYLYTLTAYDFVGNSKTGAQTVTIQGATSAAKWYSCISVTTTTKYSALDSSANKDTTTGTPPSISVSTTAGTTTQGYSAFMSSANSVIAYASGNTLLENQDYGSQVAMVGRRTANDSGGAIAHTLAANSTAYCAVAAHIKEATNPNALVTPTAVAGTSVVNTSGTVTTTALVLPTCVAAATAITMCPVTLYGASGTFPNVTTTKTHDTSGWDFGDGEAVFYSQVLPDGQIALSTISFMENELYPTADHAEINIYDPVRDLFYSLTIPTNNDSTTALKPGWNVGGTDVGAGDLTVTPDGRLIFTSFGYYFQWQISENGLYPTIGFLVKSGDNWAFDDFDHSKTAEQVEASNPTAYAVLEAEQSTNSYDESYWATQGFNQICVLPQSGNIVVGSYFEPIGYDSSVISVFDQDANLLATYQIPSMNQQDGTTPLVACTREIKADPSSSLGDERFVVIYDNFAKGANPAPSPVHPIQEFSWDSSTKVITPKSVPCISNVFDSQPGASVFDQWGNLYLAQHSIAGYGLNARAVAVFVNHDGTGRNLVSQAPATGDWATDGSYATAVTPDWLLGSAQYYGVGYPGPLGYDSQQLTVFIPGWSGKLGVIQATVPPQSGSLGSNLIPTADSTFSTWSGNWTGYVTTVSQNVARGNGDSFSINLTAPFAQNSLCALSPKKSVTPGVEYLAGAYFYSQAGNPASYGYLSIDFFDAGNNKIGTTFGSLGDETTRISTSTTWTQAVIACVAPPAAATCQVQLLIKTQSGSNMSVGTAFQADTVTLQAQPFRAIESLDLGISQLRDNYSGLTPGRPALSGGYLWVPIPATFSTSEQSAYGSSYVPAAKPQWLARVDYLRELPLNNSYPSVVRAITVIPTPTITAVINTSVTPTYVAGTTAIATPTITAESNASVTATTVAATTTIAATPGAGAKATPTVVEGTTSIPSVTVTAVVNASVTPTCVAASTEIAATVDTGANATPTTVEAVADFPDPIVSAGSAYSEDITWQGAFDLSVPTGSTIELVTVTVTHHESSITDVSSVTGQLYVNRDGWVAVGDPVAFTESLTDRDDVITVTGDDVGWNDIPTLVVRVTSHVITAEATEYIDRAFMAVDYVAPSIPFPTVVEATTSIPLPTVLTALDAAIVAVAVDGTTEVPGPVLATGAQPTPATIDATAEFPVSYITFGTLPTPTAVSGSTSIPTPGISEVSLVLANAVNGSTSIPGPTFVSSVSISPTSVECATSIPGPTVIAAGNVSVSAVTVNGSTSIPGPTITSVLNATATPATVDTTSSIAGPTITAVTSALATPATVNGSSAIPGPTFVSSVGISATTVAGTSNIPNPTVAVSVSITPVCVESATSLPTATVTAVTTALATPTTVEASSAIPLPSISAGGGASISAATVNGSTAIPSLGIITSALVVESLVTASTAIPGPTAHMGTGVAATAVNASTSIPTATITAVSNAGVIADLVTASSAIAAVASAGSKVTPATINATVDFPANLLTTEAVLSLLVVSGSSEVPTPETSVLCLILANVVSASTTIPTPVMDTGCRAVTVAATTSIPTPTVTGGSDISVGPTTVSATSSIPAVTITAVTTANVTPATIEVSTSIPSVSVTSGSGTTAIASVVEGSTSIPGPTVNHGWTVVVSTVDSAVSLPAPSVSAGGGMTATPTTVSATTSIPTPGILTGAKALPATVSAQSDFAAPGVHVHVIVPATAVDGSTAIVGPSVASSAVLGLTVVTASTGIPSAGMKTGATATPTTVESTTEVSTPTVTESSYVAPATVAASTDIPSVGISTGATVTPDTVIGSVTVPAPLVLTGYWAFITAVCVNATSRIYLPPTFDWAEGNTSGDEFDSETSTDTATSGEISGSEIGSDTSSGTAPSGEVSGRPLGE